MNNPFQVDPGESISDSSSAPSNDLSTEQFREAFAGTPFHLLQPLHPTVNYSFAVMPADPYTLELRADKWWFGGNGQLANSSLTLNTYPLEADEMQRETVREEARMEQEYLRYVHTTQGLESAMRAAEAIAVSNQYLPADRADPRLFPEGPADPFLTQREQAGILPNVFEEPPIDPDDTAPAHVWDLER